MRVGGVSKGDTRHTPASILFVQTGLTTNQSRPAILIRQTRSPQRTWWCWRWSVAALTRRRAVIAGWLWAPPAPTPSQCDQRRRSRHAHRCTGRQSWWQSRVHGTRGGRAGVRSEQGRCLLLARGGVGSGGVGGQAGHATMCHPPPRRGTHAAGAHVHRAHTATRTSGGAGVGMSRAHECSMQRRRRLCSPTVKTRHIDEPTTHTQNRHAQ